TLRGSHSAFPFAVPHSSFLRRATPSRKQVPFPTPRGRLLSERLVRASLRNAPGGSPADVPLLDQKGLDHILEGVAGLGQRRSEGFHAARSALLVGGQEPAVT